MSDTGSVQDEPIDWDAAGFVASSKYRREVLRILVENGPQRPKDVVIESDIDEITMAHASRALTQLRERDLVELLVSEERQKGRIYDTTETAERLWQTKLLGGDANGE